ncbi:MAG: HNH endonuclease [Gemmatimonadaceae bacterium]
MKGTVAVTDYGWYDFLSQRSATEVNFWTPSDHRRFAASQFSPFFFKLKAPHRAIAGFGYFAKWSSLPAWLAWECFEEGNGSASLYALESSIAEIRARIKYAGVDPLMNIGCILIVEPTFFSPEDWIKQPDDWRDRTVSGSAYDLTVGEGRRIWLQCLERARPAGAQDHLLPQVAGPVARRYGVPRPVAPRLGQGTFRVSVTDAYARACAVTMEHSLPALEAVHIRSYANEGPHEVRNGILLRADLHRLFDKGYVTVTPEHNLEVSNRLRADYNNGRTYYPLHGSLLRLPASNSDRPAEEFLSWHNDHIFLR